MDVTAAISKEDIDNPNYRRLTKKAIQDGYGRYETEVKRKKLLKAGAHNMEEEEEEEENNSGATEYDSDLLDGRPLPFKLGPMSRKLLGTPLEELDKARYDERTFVVVARKFKSSQIFRFTTCDGMWLLPPLNPLRKLMIVLLTNQFFDVFVMLTILANCVFLAIDVPRQPGEPEPLYLSIAEYVFTAIYSIEMVVKILARGFALHSHTYLRDPWNWLDFIVILLAYVTFILAGAGVDVGNFSGLRTFRVLRALKTISVVPGLKSIINAVLRSTKMLGEVLLLTIFALLIVSLLALQLFMGTLANKCVAEIPMFDDFNVSDEYFYNFTQNETNWQTWDGEWVICSNITSGGRLWSGCEANYTCLPDIGPNPNNDFTKFDHIGWSMLTCVQVITLDFWENVYNHILRAQGPWAMAFFIVTTMFGAFYLINLMLAVVSMAYTEEMENQGQEREKKAKEKRESVLQMDAEKLKKLAAKKKKKKEKQEKKQGENQTGSTNQGFEADGNSTSASTQDDNISDVGSKVSGKTGVEGSVDAAQNSSDSPGDLVSTTDSKEYGSSQDGNDATGSSDDVPAPIDDDAEERDIELCNYRCCSPCCRQCCICPWPHYKRWRLVQYWAGYFVLDPVMDLFITVCILLNTVCLAADYHGIDPVIYSVLDVANKVFTAIFAVECALKLIALGPKFFKSNWNIFDFFIVVVSLAELPLTGVKGLSGLRTVRLLRILRLAQSWTTMRTLISIVGSTLGAVANVSLVLLIIMYIFAIIGMQLFGANYIPENFPDGEVPRWNFIDFPHSFMMVFRVLCGEWIEPLYDCMLIGNKGLCITVFLLTYFVGNIMMLNLFLALLLNSFATDSLNKQAGEESRLGIAVDKIKRWIMCIIMPCLCCLRRKKNKIADSNEDLKALAITNGTANGNGIPSKRKINEFIVVEDVGKDDDKISTIDIESSNGVRTGASLMVNGTGHLHPSRAVSNGNLPHAYTNGSSRNGSAISVKSMPPPMQIPVAFVTPAPGVEPADEASLVPSTNAETGEMEQTKSASATPIPQRCLSHTSLTSIRSRRDSTKIVQTTATIEEPILEDPVKNCFPNVCHNWCVKKCTCCICYMDPNENKWAYGWRRFREVMCTVCEHRVFETIILLTIAASSITLVFEDIYLDQYPTRQEILNILNYVFVAIFTVEMFIKWLGLGFVRYFTSVWCWLDFCIVLISYLSLLADLIGLSNISAFRALRTLRALRPLRAISRWNGMKIVVNALTHAIPSIANVLLVCIVFWMIFSIVGVQFFKGTFYRCLDENGDRLPTSIVLNKSDCHALNYSWTNTNINFDNVFNGYVALFQVATFEGWMEVMESSIDSRGVDLQPEDENVFAMYLYFMIYIVFGSFFTLNLFIGVIIDNFNALKRKYEGDSSMDMFLTNNQKQYYQTMRRLGNKKPTKQIQQPTAGNKIQMFFYKLTSSNKFEILIVSIISLNMVAMMIEHYKQPQWLTDILKNVNIAFTAIFILEAIMKLIALRLHYFRIPWNTFDFIVVVLSLLGIILGDILANSFINPTLLRVLRLFRVGRILRLVKAAKGIRKLLFALVISLPALVNIGALLFLILFIFSIIGMSQFAYVKKDGALDDVVNFETWPKSILLLFRIATSAGWNDVLEPLMTDGPPDCDPNYGGHPNGDCGNSFLAVIFFVGFLLTTFLVIINMYIAVILENFSQAHAQEEIGITEDDFGMFYQVWEKYDPRASQFITYDQLSEFCDALEPPLRLARPNRIKISGLDLPIYEDYKLHCLDILFALTKRVLGDVEESEDFKELQAQMALKFAESFPDREHTKPTTTTMQINKRNQAAKVVQRAYRYYVLQREIRRAVLANRAAQAFSSSVSNSRRNSTSQEQSKDNLDASNASSLGPALALPGQLGLSRTATPTIPEEPKDNGSTSHKAEKYHVESDSDVPTIDATVDIVTNSETVAV